MVLCVFGQLSQRRPVTSLGSRFSDHQTPPSQNSPRPVPHTHGPRHSPADLAGLQFHVFGVSLTGSAHRTRGAAAPSLFPSR